MRAWFALILIAMSVGCTRGVDDDATRTQLGVQGLAGQRAAAADRWMDELLRRREAGDALTPPFVAQLLDAARLRAIARADASPDLPAKAAAYRAYRDFAGELLRQYDRSTGDRPPEVYAHIRYAIADAEWRMALVTP